MNKNFLDVIEIDRKKILITGITGFLGSNLAKALINKGYEVVALKRRSSSLNRIVSILDKVILYDIEDIDYTNFFKSFGKIDVIIHTATSYGRNNETPWEIFDANTGFPLRLLDAASDANVSKFINTDTILDKYLNLYALSKNHLLEWGKFYSMHRKIEFINMRLEHFYGPGDDDSKFTSYVINSCMKNLNSMDLTLGEQKRDFIYVDDVVNAYLTILTREIKGDFWFSEHDVGSGHSVTIREFVEMVRELTGSRTKLNFGAVKYREGEVMNSMADISSLKSLGWNCDFSLKEGLEKTINSIKK